MEFALKVALVIFFAKLTDPVAILPAVVAGYFCRTWWQVVISAAAVGIVVEMILVLFQQTPEIHQGRLLMGVLAAGVWSNLAFAFKMWRVKRARKIGDPNSCFLVADASGLMQSTRSTCATPPRSNAISRPSPAPQMAV